MPLFDDLSEAILYHAYRNLVNGPSKDGPPYEQSVAGLVQPHDIYSRQSLEFSNEYLWRAFDSLRAKGLLSVEIDGSKFHFITNDGIASVEMSPTSFMAAYQRICSQAPQPEIDSDKWKQADEIGHVTSKQLEEIKIQLAQLRKIVEQTNLSQQDRSQADQHIKAAQEISEAPTPRLQLIINIIRPFTNSFLSETAKKLINIILPGN